jgi:thiol-disulfide isomerase/thioredoxin
MDSSQPSSMMKKDKTMMPQKESSMDKVGSMLKKDDSVMEGDAMASSRYVQYSRSALDSAKNGRTVLFFYASWCPTCKPADTSFTQNANKIPGDMTLIRVNYNDTETDQEEKDLAKKYNITYQHTFVQIDSTGKEITKWNGGQIDELLSNIK